MRAETALSSPPGRTASWRTARLTSRGWTPACLMPASSEHPGWRVRPQDPGGRDSRLLACERLCFDVCPEPNHSTRLECWPCAGLRAPRGPPHLTCPGHCAPPRRDAHPRPPLAQTQDRTGLVSASVGGDRPPGHPEDPTTWCTRRGVGGEGACSGSFLASVQPGARWSTVSRAQ